MGLINNCLICPALQLIWWLFVPVPVVLTFHEQKAKIFMENGFQRHVHKYSWKSNFMFSVKASATIQALRRKKQWDI